jgi:hypothetical protein
LRRIEAPGGKRKWYAIAFFLQLLVVAILLVGNANGGRYYLSPAGILVVLLVLGLFSSPALVWYMLGRKVIGPRYLILVFPGVMRRVKKFLQFKRTHESLTDAQYFLHEPGRVSVAKRSLLVFLSTLGVSAVLLPFTEPAFSDYGLQSYSLNVYLSLTGFNILTLMFLPFVFFPVWVYEDMGLRHFDPENATVEVPGSGLKELVGGFGAFLSLFGLLPLFSKDPNFLPDFVFALAGAAIVTLPFVVIASVAFCYSIEPSLIAKFERNAIIGKISASVVNIILADGTHQGSTKQFLCSSCKAPVRVGSKFCISCGAPTERFGVVLE